MKKLFFLTILLNFYYGLNAQNAVNIIEPPLTTMNCPDSCITLHATFSQPLKTDVYTVSSIPFSPVSITGTTINMNDDKFTTAIPIGFNFCFFDNVYTQCYIADNGVLSFNSDYNNVSCNNNTQQTLPYFNSTYPDDAIFFLYMDVNPVLGGTVKYQTMGTAPFRKFIVSYQNVRLFGNSCPNTTSTFQVVLYETTHVIETYITNKVLCDNNPANHANYATVAIQNLGATAYYAAPGKHASVFTTVNEGIRFSPAGGANYTLTWRDNAGNILATNVDSVSVCPDAIPYNCVKAELQINCPPSFLYDSVILTKPLPVVTNVQIVSPFCADDSTGVISINANFNTPPGQYSMNNGPFQPTNVFSNLQGGTYTITLQDADGCERDTAIEVIPTNVMQIIVDTMILPICPDSNGKLVVHMIGGTPPYSIFWSNGDIGNVCDSLGITQVIATVTDSNGCTQEFPFTLSYDSIPEMANIISKPHCGDSSGFITINITNGNPPYQILWNTGDTTATITGLWAGNTYALTVTDAIGCTGVYSHYMVDTLTTETNTLFSDTHCGIMNGYATVLADSGLPPYTYMWMPGGQTTSSITNLSPGTYTCVTSDADNCTAIDSFTVLPSLPTFNNVTSSNSNCDTNNGAIYLNSVTNATPPVSYLWSNGATTSAIIGVFAGTYWVTSTDVYGCQTTNTVTLTDDGKPSLMVASYDPPLCWGHKGSAVLDGSLGTSPYKYSIDGILFSSNAQLNNILAGVYTIYISDANSCINTTVITFAQPPLIEVDYEADTIVCYGDATSTVNFHAFGGTPGYEYSFNNGLFSSDTIFYEREAGIYPLVVRDANHCLRPFNLLVPGPPSPLDVKFNKKDLYCRETNTGSFSATILGGWSPYTYKWNNDSVGLAFNNLPETDMTITVTDDKGCVINKEINVEILGCCQMIVPNAFSPNGDGLNDYLRPIGISSVSGIRFSIYDRWGHRVYFSKDPDEKWDGNYKGNPCTLGTYFYYLEYNCPYEYKTFTTKGDITLIR